MPPRKTPQTHPYFIRISNVDGHRRPHKHCGQVVRFLSEAGAKAHAENLRRWLPGGTVLEVDNNSAS